MLALSARGERRRVRKDWAARERAKHVVFWWQGFSDGGSTPPASTTSDQDVVSRAKRAARSRGARVLHLLFYVYILECADKSYYVGVTDDPARRVDEHNSGKGADWTARRRPVVLVWKEQHPTLSSARKRENQIKRWSRAKKLALIRGSLRLRSGQVPANGA